MVFERVNWTSQLMFGRLSVRCSVVAVIGVLCVFAAVAGDVNSGSVGGVEESEPNDFFGVLEFRIAPQNALTSRMASPLTTKEIGQCRKDLAENGPLASMKRDDEFVWMKIMGGVKLLGDRSICSFTIGLLLRCRPGLTGVWRA